MSKFWIDYPEMVEELRNVQNIMKENIRASEKYFEDSILPMVDGGGKMLRPAFLILASKFGEYEPKKIYNLAAVIEMLHLATLVHDDIIDEAKLRRGCETIQSKYGKEYAVYIGDYLFCQCFMMLSEYEYTMENMRGISKAISKICMGEIRQYHLRYAKSIDIRKYLRIISGKTAGLFALSFYIGAKESQCNEKLAKLLGKIGYQMGMAFQIMDDLLDYNGDSCMLGKAAQNDLKRGYYTLPIIYALEKDKDKKISRILDQSSLDDEEIRQIIKAVGEYKGIERAQAVANRYTERAFENIHKLPNGDTKEMLMEVIGKLLKRNY